MAGRLAELISRGCSKLGTTTVFQEGLVYLIPIPLSRGFSILATTTVFQEGLVYLVPLPFFLRGLNVGRLVGGKVLAYIGICFSL